MKTAGRILCVFMLAAVLAPGCGDSGGGGDCVPHDSTVCAGGKVYYKDSCGVWEEEKEACACGCDDPGTGCRTPCDCVPQCAGRCCGDNGCGGTCPDNCAAGQTCNGGTCQCQGACTPKSCAELGKECGQWDDGCGGQADCGGCAGGAACSAEGRCSCSAGETRCVGSSYQVCRNGTFEEVEVCSGPSVCLVGIGCAGCDPAQGDTCYQGNVHACNPDGSVGDLVETCWTEPCSDGACEQAGCPPETQLIYVVDDAYRLLSFNPFNDLNEFTLIGSLSCPAGPSWPDWGGGGTATPFSMAVDRQARAWVLYTSGEIFWVDTTDASCQLSPYPKGQDDYKLFGMGFVSDAPGSDEEKLYIAGGNVDAQVMGNMAYIDPGTLQLTTIGPCPQAEYGPELTGTGKAEWFGYFPGTSNTFIAKLNKQTGQIDLQWSLPGLGTNVRAWAFAHWGGRFYVFVTTYTGSYNSQVLRLDPNTGQTETLLQNLPYIIVGAGVSTCAPYQ